MGGIGIAGFAFIYIGIVLVFFGVDDALSKRMVNDTDKQLVITTFKFPDDRLTANGKSIMEIDLVQAIKKESKP